MNKHIRVLLLFIFILSAHYPSFAISRYFTWIDPKSYMRLRIDLDNYDLFSELASGGWKNEGKINVNPADLKDLPPSIDNEYFFYDQGGRIRLTLGGTGQVFDYIQASKKLSRIDRTIHSGFNFGAQRFIRKGVIHSFGGTGFWSFSQALTYYDEKTAEWQLLRPRNPGPVSIYNGYQGYSAKSDVFYSGGSEFYRFLGNLDKEYSDELFAFDFKTNEWVLLGDINADLPNKKLLEIIWTGNYFIHFSNDKLYTIDPAKNKVYEYYDPKIMLQGGYMNYSKGDTVIRYWHINYGPVVKFSISEILAKSEFIGPFYTPKTNIWFYLLGLGIAFVVFGIYLWWRKKGSNKSKALIFNNLERTLLLKLMELNTNEHLTSYEINDVLETTNKTQENQRKIRITFINQLNNKLKLKFNIENGIERKSLQEDKRLTIYVLNQQIKTEIENLLK